MGFLPLAGRKPTFPNKPIPEITQEELTWQKLLPRAERVLPV